MESNDVLNLHDYAPYYIRATANKLAQAASKSYGERFGIGLNEWACLALLASEPDIPAARISEVGGFDKAIISRSIHSLEAKGYVSARRVANHNRKKLLRLTSEGEQIYGEIRDLARAREERLLEGMGIKDRKKLLELLRIIHTNSLRLDQEELNAIHR